MRISKERWLEAQEAERRFHSDPKQVAIEKYKDSYRQYFEWLGMSTDLKGKRILEIGCADIPALYFCDGAKSPTIIEPMPSSILYELAVSNYYELITEPAEDVLGDPLLSGKEYDEVWFFNVLQHVLDPDELVEKAKAACKTVRFFEPVDQPVSDCHPHAPTQEDFKRWFGESAKLYEGNPNAVNFHTAKCMYGTWTEK